MYALFWQHTQIEAWFCWHIAMCKQNHALFWIVEFKFEQKPNAAFISVSLLSHDDQGYRENMQNSLKSESQIWEDGSGNEFKTKIHKKNTKNWYIIDALGAIFATRVCYVSQTRVMLRAIALVILPSFQSGLHPDDGHALQSSLDLRPKWRVLPWRRWYIQYSPLQRQEKYVCKSFVDGGRMALLYLFLV